MASNETVQRISVKSIGQTLAIDVQALDTVAQVKSRIQEKTGILPECQELIFAGKALKDDSTLEDYDVAMESTLHLVQIKGKLKPEQIEPYHNKETRAAYAKQQQNDKVTACKPTRLIWHETWAIFLICRGHARPLENRAICL